MESQRADVKGSGSLASFLKDHDVRAKKRLGQNFLVDGNILNRIVTSAGIGKEDTVLEIGPGTGNLTRHLCEAAGQVYAFEIDEKLIPVLNDALKEYENAEVINKDILKVDLNEFIKEKDIRGSIKVTANLPYYITTPILTGLLTSRLPIESITVMIQSEVAERMVSLPGKKTYGSLTLLVSYFSEPERVIEVPPSCFIPRPKVSSTVIKLNIRKEPPVLVKDEKLLFSIIRASFNQRRKTLYNGLKNSPEIKASPENIAQAIESLGKSSTVRGEQLSLKEFALLADHLTS